MTTAPPIIVGNVTVSISDNGGDFDADWTQADFNHFVKEAKAYYSCQDVAQTFSGDGISPITVNITVGATLNMVPYTGDRNSAAGTLGNFLDPGARHSSLTSVDIGINTENARATYVYGSGGILAPGLPEYMLPILGNESGDAALLINPNLKIIVGGVTETNPTYGINPNAPFDGVGLDNATFKTIHDNVSIATENEVRDSANQRATVDDGFAYPEVGYRNTLSLHSAISGEYEGALTDNCCIPAWHKSSRPVTYGVVHDEPLVLNLTANSAPNITSLEEGTQFDLQNNGFAEQTAWVGAGSGMLVYDPTGGAVTNGSQLFGTSYSLSGGGYAVDGFAALANLDSNSDGVINSSDSAWSSLRVWVDSNINGVVDAGELETMSAAGISSFSLTTTNNDTTDANGNYIGKTATYSLVGGGTRESADVSFVTDPFSTTPDSTVSLNGTISLLPEITGFGTVTSLQQAMQIQANASDTTLETYVQDFVAATDDATRNTLVDEIIYQWTGVESVSPSSRGSYFDAQKLEALEQFNGQAFIDPYNSTANPGNQFAPVLTEAYQQLHDWVLAGLERQTDLASLFADIETAFNTDAVTTYLDFSAAETEILNDLSANRANALVTLTDFNQALHALGMDDDEGYATFRSDLAEQGTDVAATFLYGTPVVYGTAGDDAITAWAGNQTVIATQGGSDTLESVRDHSVF